MGSGVADRLERHGAAGRSLANPFGMGKTALCSREQAVTSPPSSGLVPEL